MDSAAPAPSPRPVSSKAAAPILRPAFLLCTASLLFGLLTFFLSWWRWWTFKYHTFDLAFYVQALWLGLRGESQVSLLHVPLLGNHAEPIVWLFLPLFAVCPHPMLLVAVQVGALSTMPFSARRIALRLGLAEWPAVMLALATLAAPASGYVAIHEFHPEAFSAPLFLLMAEARLAGRLRSYWLWFLLALACKENIALVLALWSALGAWDDRKCEWSRQWNWNFFPAFCAAAWIAAYAFLLSPSLNGGRVDYGNLYAGLGSSAGEMLMGCFRQPSRVLTALWQGVSNGNLLWAMILSFAGLSLLRPRWLLLASPIFLQHLLSARASEWQIYFHYAAPLVSLLWLGAAEAISHDAWGRLWAPVPLVCSLILQFFVGPAREFVWEAAAFEQSWWNRSWKAAMVEPLARDPSLSISAGLPYLSHLATRRQLYSIHFVIKGLKTLSRRRYEADYDPDAVLIDFADEGTFGKAGGYYHPPGAIDANPLPSSDELLNRFLARRPWTSTSRNALLLLRRSGQSAEPPAPPAGADGIALFDHTTLLGARLAGAPAPANLAVQMAWQFRAPRSNIPWLDLELIGSRGVFSIPLGMCAPQSTGAALEAKEVLVPPWLPEGRYKVAAVYLDEVRRLWGKSGRSPVLATIELGDFNWQGAR